MYKLALVLAATAALQGTLPPSDNLVVKNVPAPSLSIVERAEKYTDFRTASASSWHPTKREMLIRTRFADTSQVHVVKQPGGARTQLTFYKDTATNASFEPTAGNYFVFDKDKGGDEFFQKYAYDVDSKNVSLLTDGKSRNTGGVWAHEGHQYAYGSTRRNGADVDLWVMDPADPKSNRLIAELAGGGWEPQDWSRDNKSILVIERISATESYVWLIDVATGAKVAFTERKDPKQVSYAAARFSHDGKGIYVTTDKDSEFQRLAYIDLQTKKLEFLAAGIQGDVGEFDVSWDGKKIAFTVNQDGYDVVHLIDAVSHKELPLPALPKGLAGGLMWHKNNRDLALSMETARSPADAYSIDTKDGKVERWTTSETGFLNTNTLVEPKLIHWTSFDGRQIPGFLYTPPEKFTGKRPVIINIHGGPEGQARPGFLGRQNYYMNELGVAMIFPNIRGSIGYGKTYCKLDNGFKREDSYKDIEALLAWIKQQPDLDGDRIMVTGGSYGGHMTLAVATRYADKIRCALDVVGFSNLISFLEHTEAYRRDLRRVEYGDERDPKMRAFMEKIAPLNHSADIKKPLFIVQGKNDPRVPASEAEQMVKAVESNGTPIWFLMANDEGHGFKKKKNADYQFYSTVEFVEKYLLN